MGRVHDWCLAGGGWDVRVLSRVEICGDSGVGILCLADKRAAGTAR